MTDVKNKTSCSNPVERVVMWWALTFGWIIKLRRFKSAINKQMTQGEVNTFKNNLWLTIFKYQPNHWTYRDFKSMCYKRIYLIECANKDLQTHNLQANVAANLQEITR